MPVLKAKYNGEWINVSGGGSSVSVDTTLTQEGQAADAKAVGDTINNLGCSDEDIFNLITETDMIMAVADSDGSLLTDENENILEW